MPDDTLHIGVDSASDPEFPASELLEPFVGPSGLIATALGGYEHRPGQEAMMQAVMAAVERRHVLLVEAGTGTGKSLAYLIPAALAAEPVIVSTGSKTLQDQLFHKDIPFVRDTLNIPFKAALLKGRTNYLCLHKLEESQHAADRVAEHGGWFQVFETWAGQTDTGDRAELAKLPDDALAWRDVSSGAEECLGQGCEFFDDCFVMRARRRALSADVVVVNHHLFFADLSLRDSAGFSLLPPSDVVIFDEAHHVEDVAAMYFGLRCSNYRIRDLTYDAQRAMTRVKKVTTELLDICDRARGDGDALFDAYEPLFPRGRVDPERVPPEVRPRWFTLDNRLAQLAEHLKEAARDGDDEVLTRLVVRTHELRSDLEALVEARDRSLVVWVDKGAKAVFLHAAPIDVGAVLQQTLFSSIEALIFTSATLTTRGNFSHIRQRLGIDYLCRELAVASPFDYAAQSLLYMPDHLPAPRAPEFVERLADEIERLLDVTRGRAFVLFTSFSNMHRVHELLRASLPYPTFIQGEGSKDALLDAFRTTEHAVLFGTSSFWEGVDVAGQALTQVIIDKLPFAPPDDPLTSARIEWLTEQGLNAFMSYQVPVATIALKQGFGRLIRHRTDRGIVSILDRRLTRARYGLAFIDSLPPAKRVHTLEELDGAWREIHDARVGEKKSDDLTD